jgi:membrane protein DedA with SNARE-associated domain
VAAALWACGLGLGAYVIGPTVLDLLDDAGLIAGIVIGLVVIAAAVTEIHRRRRRALTRD